MHTLRRFTLALTVMSALTVVVVAGPALAANHAHAASKYPPCTKQALKPALKRGPAKEPNGRFIGTFGCVRNWAYSGAVIGTGRGAFDATILYHNNNGRWQTSRRAGPCRTHAVPKKIYRPACETN